MTQAALLSPPGESPLSLAAFATCPRVLHLGCGSAYVQGALNVDPFDRTVCDLRACGQSLPLADGCLDEVQLLHVLEHIGWAGSTATLAECHRVLAPGGRLVVETPDAEGALRTLIDGAAQARPEALRPVFGKPGDPGMGHTALLPEPLLRLLLERAGFTDVVAEPQRTHLGEPGLRLVAARRADPRYLLLARLRQQLLADGQLATLAHAEQLELEERFFEVLRGLPDVPSATARASLLELIVLVPAAAAAAIALLRRTDLLHGCELADLARLAADAQRSGLDRVMWQALQRYAATPSGEADPVGRIAAEARGLLVRQLESPEAADLAGELALRLEPGRGHTCFPALQGYRLPAQGPFLPSRVGAAARRVLAEAIAHLGRGRVSRGRLGLQLAANLRQDRVYPQWNLAVVQVQLGKLERALSFYRAARFQAQAPSIAAALEHEEACCLAALGREQEAAWLGQRSRAVARRAAGRKGELFGDEGGTEGGAPADATGPSDPITSFPPPRTRPVMIGEAWRRLP